jgi:hypothetical protein
METGKIAKRDMKQGLQKGKIKYCNNVKLGRLFKLSSFKYVIDWSIEESLLTVIIDERERWI